VIVRRVAAALYLRFGGLIGWLVLLARSARPRLSTSPWKSPR
jgi:hypothetical protein